MTPVQKLSKSRTLKYLVQNQISVREANSMIVTMIVMVKEFVSTLNLASVIISIQEVHVLLIKVVI